MVQATLGVQMFTLREFTQDEKSLDECLKKVSDIGYRSVQVSAFGADVAPERTAELCEKYGLAIGGTHVSWDRFRQDIDAVIAEHKLWGCQHTAIGMIPPAEYLSLEGMNRFLEEAAPVTKALGDAGISFSYHNHSHEFLQFDGKPWLAHLYERASEINLKMELDTHWIVAGGGDPAAWVDRCGDDMPLLHLKDFRVNEEFKRRFAPVGDGNMNWSAILAAAAKHPIEYYFIEQDNCYGEDPFACLERSFNYLHNEHGLD